MVKSEIKIYSSPSDLAEEFAGAFIRMINRQADRKGIFTVALSGGNTPKLLFAVLAEKFPKSVSWQNVHFFWGDERCVPSGDPESNYGAAKNILFDKINIPVENIHRIIGESNPDEEAIRYSSEIKAFIRAKNRLPSFNLMILGVGEDGHTASIFPGNEELLVSERICEVAIHPVTHQKRITLTGNVINNSEFIVFLVAGRNKAKVVADIKERPHSVSYPAGAIKPVNGVLVWYLDDEAAGKLGNK